MARPAILTQHGRKRVAERLGCGRKAAARAAEVALARGIHHEQATGRLRRYLDRRQVSDPTSLFVVHGAYIYVFARETRRLITMFALPRPFVKGSRHQ